MLLFIASIRQFAMWPLASILLFPVLSDAKLRTTTPPPEAGVVTPLQDGIGKVNDTEGASCSQRLFELLGNPSYDAYTDCVEEGLNHSILPHSSAAINAQCWCKWNMSGFVRSQGCSEHANWKWLMQVDCHSDCSDAGAADCRSCPAFCFEGATGLPGCECHDQCLRYLGCWPSNHTQEPGESQNSSDQVCDASFIRRSQKMQDFGSCAASNFTYSNRWTSLSDTYQCLCQTNLQQELQKRNCCEDSHSNLSAHGFCQANCSLDCRSREAIECQTNCTQWCQSGSFTKPDAPECTERCMADAAPCHRYKVCPAPKPAFPYVCDDGGAPSPNGCCSGVFDTDRCPLLCKVQFRTTVLSQTGLSAKCTCAGCPATEPDAKRLMNKTLMEVFERAATKQMMFIVVTRHLNGVNQQMRLLFAQQMEAMEQAIRKYRGTGLLDWNLVHTLRTISYYYFQKLSIAADHEVLALTNSSTTGMVWFALISSVCIIATVVIGVLISKGLSHARSQATQVTPHESQMVVGRPVYGKEPSELVQGALDPETEFWWARSLHKATFRAHQQGDCLMGEQLLVQSYELNSLSSATNTLFYNYPGSCQAS
ncbi:unnamed protein product [Durusdinium trenchii]|uniref:Uncharacterized protein n=1 Tax=Durusdinium trenchii TaxID=1381693 RepID=A0ABP0JHN7_9DINO